MTSFLFSPADSQDLSTGVFYAHVVSTEPSLSATTVSQINITDAIGYSPYTLTGLVFNTLKWTFSNFVYPTYNYVTSPCGIVVCKRIGITPASTDPVLYYASLGNSLSQTIAFPTGKYVLYISFPVDGIIVYNQYYNYNSGPFINTEPIPKGLMYLLGTRNNTQSFLQPRDNSILVTCSDPNTRNYFFDRVINNDQSNPNNYIAVNYGSRRIRLGTIGIKGNKLESFGWNIYGSNIASGITALDVNLASNWTLLGTTPNTNTTWQFATCTDLTYWKYLKFSTTNGSNGTIDEIEFYNSSMYSTNPDLMSTVIDSPFNATTLDYSGFGHTWSLFGSPVILNNSLYLDGSTALLLNSSPLFNLTTRNFELSLDFKWISQLTDSNPGILNWDGSDSPLIYSVYLGSYNHAIGTPLNWFYLPNGGNIGVPSTANYDALKTIRVGNTFTTTTSVSNTIYTGVTGGSIGDSINVQIGVNNGRYITGYIRNVKLVT